jgi:hypothetical protein
MTDGSSADVRDRTARTEHYGATPGGVLDALLEEVKKSLDG